MLFNRLNIDYAVSVAFLCFVFKLSFSHQSTLYLQGKNEDSLSVKVNNPLSINLQL